MNSRRFKYEIEVLATKKVDRFEVHVQISQLGEKINFYTGLYCNSKTYINLQKDTFSLDPLHYGFEKCFWFSFSWIENVLYDYYIQSLTDPYTKQLYSAKQKILDDIGLLMKSSSFNYSFNFLLLDKFKTHLDEDPTYDEYANYHRFLDCMLDYQLKTRSILTKNSPNKSEFFKSLNSYPIQMHIFKLESELKDFINWTHQNKIDLFDEKDYIWALDV